LALVHPAGDGDQREMEWGKDSLVFKAHYRQLPGNSREQSQIQADQYSDHTGFAPTSAMASRGGGEAAARGVSQTASGGE
jgi:hypothetical protein